jgi:hypothetical protein
LLGPLEDRSGGRKQHPSYVKAKVAVTLRAWVINTTQPAAPKQSPDQPVNVDPTSAVAVNVTGVPNKYDSEQTPGHEIPDPDTDPDPITDTDKLSVVWV